MLNLQRKIENFKLECPLEYDVPLASFTTFRVGGPAEVLARPRTTSELAQLVAANRTLDAPLTVLGGGANVVVSDQGIPGLVIHTGELRGIRHEGTTLHVAAGTPISDAAAYAADHSLAGLAFIYAMPGSTGGAIWMNARCYDGEIAPILQEVRYLSLREEDYGEVHTYRTRQGDFDYKISPFQDGGRVILEGTFDLQPGDSAVLRREMEEHREDRQRKGHFDAPCAGSIFKNNRNFGAPSGQIIDQLGLRGMQNGGAQVSKRHGNIIINRGSATAREIRDLVEEVQRRVFQERGLLLEPEILFPGEWEH